ncbi:MAG: helix-turn-helix transcriptional regulator [Planctomycetes bacterium]|nr:helix-turn-helix transcriptional regulator [Planctomycetota bacterium]
MSEGTTAMGERLQDLRLSAGLSQSQLARRASIPTASLKNWEQGLRLPRLDAAYRLAKALGISLDLLAGRIFEEPPGAGGDGKVSGAAQEATRGGKTAGTPARQKKPAGGKGRKHKGTAGKKGA